MTNTHPSKNDHAWQHLFRKYKILEQLQHAPFFEISATQINTEREARLMTKFDHATQLPTPFRENRLGILPLTRGTYAIGTFHIFHTIEDLPTATYYLQPHTFLQSLDLSLVTNEATAIHLAHTSGILAHFTNEKVLYPTISGRMGTSTFEFDINHTSQTTIALQVENAQIEIDAGYESPNALYLIEAKNHLANDFNVRQLYYPYRLWRERLSKPVRLIYLTYSDATYSLREYQFINPKHYNSLALQRHLCYRFLSGHLTLVRLKELIASTPIHPLPRDPLPQADSFERIVNLCERLLQDGSLTKQAIAQQYDFTPRQADYYIAAAKYLQLVAEKKSQHEYQLILSELGLEIFSMPIPNRRIALIQQILSIPPFRGCFALFLACELQRPPLTSVLEVLARYYPELSTITLQRRTSTVVAWLAWICSWCETPNGLRLYCEEHHNSE